MYESSSGSKRSILTQVFDFLFAQENMYLKFFLFLFKLLVPCIFATPDMLKHLKYLLNGLGFTFQLLPPLGSGGES